MNAQEQEMYLLTNRVMALESNLTKLQGDVKGLDERVLVNSKTTASNNVTIQGVVKTISELAGILSQLQSLAQKTSPTKAVQNLISKLLRK